MACINAIVAGGSIFEWFTNPQGPNQRFEFVIHAVFGHLLVSFFLGPHTPFHAARDLDRSLRECGASVRWNEKRAPTWGALPGRIERLYD
jgi:hypothetical protein